MREVDKILYKMGYFNSDPQKQSEVEEYIEEAVEYMKNKGVPEEKLTSHSAYVIKSIWADSRDKGKEAEIVKKDGMIAHLIFDLRR